MPLTILATYAPRKGYSKQEQTEHWKQIQDILDTIPEKHMILWCADTIGQLGEIKENGETNTKIIGPNRIQDKAEKGNGRQSSQICMQQHTIPMNTWERAPLTKEEKRYIQEQPDPVTAKKQIERDNLNTWISPGGKTTRQIDYITINHKYRNCVQRAWPIQNWRGDETQQRQHAVIRMDITLNLIQKYYKPHIKETGTQIQYDIQQLKDNPSKMDLWYKQRK